MLLKKTIAIGIYLSLYCSSIAQSFINRASDFGITQGYGQLSLEEFGGGLSFYDFNGDGWDDLSFASAKGDSLHFFQNNKGTFVKIAALASDTTASKHLLWADIDNDGDQDLLVTNHQAPNRLYENDGAMNLTDITATSGLLDISDMSYGAAFGDYDLDGDLDLYISNRSNGVFDMHTNYLYQNNGDKTFTNISLSTNSSDGLKAAFCAAFLDINHNLYPDIFIANDRIASNTLLGNLWGDGYSDISSFANVDFVINAMNVGNGDCNNDGYLDIYVTNTNGNLLHINNGDNTFSEMGVENGVFFGLWSWGANFLDSDNDGDLDLYVSAEKSGHQNGFFLNDGTGSFSQIFPSGMESDTLRSFANAVGDYNQDGLLDIVVSNAYGDPIQFWENQSDTANNWLKVQLTGTTSNRDGIGAWIELYNEGQQQVRYTDCGTAYLAQNTKNIHFGIGTNTLVDSLIVRWPSGIIDKLYEVAPKQILQLKEGTTIPEPVLNFTSFFTGNETDTISNPTGGICLMGGATENDNAMRWFLERAKGGDILVLRASGSDGYNEYLYAELGVPVNSVETIVCNDSTASNDSYVLQKIQQAEAIWFAGGDQWDYVSFWRNTPVDSLINQAIKERNIVIGGTSAGMAIQGQYYFSAQNGTVTSDEALSNPFDKNLTVDSTTFILNDWLKETITDTHFDNPDRKGRLVTFLARIYNDSGILGKAIACDENTAVCISPNGIAQVFGDHPEFDDNAYFVQANCALDAPIPELISPQNALTWNHDGQALKVHQIKGTSTGSNTFDLNDWETGTGGTWLDWSVFSGIFQETAGDELDCTEVATLDLSNSDWQLYPNPTEGYLSLKHPLENVGDANFVFYNSLGQEVPVPYQLRSEDEIIFDMEGLEVGVYYLRVSIKSRTYSFIGIKM